MRLQSLCDYHLQLRRKYHKLHQRADKSPCSVWCKSCANHRKQIYTKANTRVCTCGSVGACLQTGVWITGESLALYGRKGRQKSVLVLHFIFTGYSHIRHHTENLGVSQKWCLHVPVDLFPERGRFFCQSLMPSAWLEIQKGRLLSRRTWAVCPCLVMRSLRVPGVRWPENGNIPKSLLTWANGIRNL